MTTYKIHPAMGVARLGTAQPDPLNKENYYIAPESEGALPSDPLTGEPVSSFRDAQGKLLKQAARFQVYAYEDGDTEGVPVVPGMPGISIGSSGPRVRAILWTVYLANKKAAWYEFKQLTGSGQQGDAGYLANGPNVNPLRVNDQVTDRSQLILDPGPRTVGDGISTASFDLPPGPTTDATSFKPLPITQLGSLYADDEEGTLLVFGGDGNSGTTNLRPAEANETPTYEYAIRHYANNEGWFDDIADGSVSATLILEDDTETEMVDAGSAWCLVAPPKYAPQVNNMVNLFDTIYDVAVREQGYRPDLHNGTSYNTSYQVDFEREIAPLLQRPLINRWVVAMIGEAVIRHQDIARLESSQGAHFPMRSVRQPDQINGPGSLTLMPRLAGDNPLSSHTPSQYLTLTQTQVFLLTQWMNQHVAQQGTEEPRGVALDHGVLRNCVGGAFCPGIEITWICRNPHIYSEPFRIRPKAGVEQGSLDPLNGNDNLYSDGVEPGDLSKYMAQPWQADFNECDTQHDISGQNPGKEWWWWPAQRPYNVIPEGNHPAYADWTRGYTDNPDQPTFTHPSLGDLQMVIDWKHLGFLLRKNVSQFGELIVEVERQGTEIDDYQDPTIDSSKP